MLSPGIRQVFHALLTRPPLTHKSLGFNMSPFDLHVLGTPPAFILSQDQTLMLKSFRCFVSFYCFLGALFSQSFVCFFWNLRRSLSGFWRHCRLPGFNQAGFLFCQSAVSFLWTALYHFWYGIFQGLFTVQLSRFSVLPFCVPRGQLVYYITLHIVCQVFFSFFS